MTDQLSDEEWRNLTICVHCRHSHGVLGDRVVAKLEPPCCLCGGTDVLTDVPLKYRQKISDLMSSLKPAKPRALCPACHVAAHPGQPLGESTACGFCSRCGTLAAMYRSPPYQAQESKKPEPKYRALCARCGNNDPAVLYCHERCYTANHCESCGTPAAYRDIYKAVLREKLVPPEATSVSKPTIINTEDLRSIFARAQEASTLVVDAINSLCALEGAFRTIYGSGSPLGSGGASEKMKGVIDKLRDGNSQIQAILDKKPKI